MVSTASSSAPSAASASANSASRSAAGAPFARHHARGGATIAWTPSETLYSSSFPDLPSSSNANAWLAPTSNSATSSPFASRRITSAGWPVNCAFVAAAFVGTHSAAWTASNTTTVNAAV